MAALLADLAVEAAGCTNCPLAATRTNVVFGVGDPHAPLMIVGEAPGKDEDEQGEPFVGRSGKLLDQVMLEELGVTRDRVFIANTLQCRPPGNRDPLPDEIATCRPWLEAKLDAIAPKVVITLGNFATKLLLFDDPKAKEGITKLRGKTYPWRHGAVLVPTFHPSAVLRSGGGQPLAQMRADFIRAKRALADAGVSLDHAHHA
jgi:uracil-DNA glycosylase family 4